MVIGHGAFGYTQLFRERLSEKVHATNPKGIVGGFELTVFQRNLKEWQERPSAEAADVCQGHPTRI